jgi:hypothetical protein
VEVDCNAFTKDPSDPKFKFTFSDAYGEPLEKWALRKDIQMAEPKSMKIVLLNGGLPFPLNMHTYTTAFGGMDEVPKLFELPEFGDNWFEQLWWLTLPDLDADFDNTKLRPSVQKA